MVRYTLHLFINSSKAYPPSVIYGAHGLRRVQPRSDGGLLSTLAFPYWGLIGVGLLSAWFHSTLKYHSQMGDDLSMFLAVGALLHQLLCFEATPAQRRKYTAAILGSLIPVSVYHVWADEIYVHEIVFGLMVFMVSRRVRALIKKRVKSEESKKRLGKMATFGICEFASIMHSSHVLLIRDSFRCVRILSVVH
jgi:dihydroceramidase